MPRMTQKGDNEDFKAWLRESVLALCRGGLSYRKDFSIEGVLGITIDHSDVLLVRIHDKDTSRVSKCEKATQVCYTDRGTTHFHEAASVGENGLSESGSDTPPSSSDPPPCSDPRAMEQSPVNVPLVHNRQQRDNISVHSSNSQLSSDGGDFQWPTSEPLMLSSQDGRCETKIETVPQIESDLDSLIDSRNSGAADFIPSAEVSDVASDGQISQPVFDAVDVHMNSTDNILTKIKQELNVESWNEQCHSYEPSDTFGNYTSQQEPAWDFGGSHNFPTIAADSPQQKAQLHQAKIPLPQLNTVGDTVSVSLGTATSTPVLNWTWCGLCKQGTRNLKRHMKVCQMSPAMLSEAKFPCSKCSRLFRTRSYLIDHERSYHSSVPSYECCHCRRFFKYRMQLKRHKAHCNVSVANDALSVPCTQPVIPSPDLCLKL